MPNLDVLNTRDALLKRVDKALFKDGEAAKKLETLLRQALVEVNTNGE